jgi:hypothetical protein
VGPWVWQDTNGEDKLQALPDGNGGIKMFSITPYAPIIEFMPAPASLNAGWILPLAGLALLVIAIAAIGWPVVRLVRYRYGYKADMTGRPLLLHRITRGTAWLFLIVLIGWFGIMMLLESDLSALDNGLDIWMRLLQLLLIGAIVGTAVAIWNAWTVATAPGRHRFATFWAILIALSAAFLVWLSLNVGLLTPSLNY